MYLLTLGFITIEFKVKTNKYFRLALLKTQLICTDCPFLYLSYLFPLSIPWVFVQPFRDLGQGRLTKMKSNAVLST